ncbi:hypothetical protein ACFLRM_00135 [Acidobacteriota bacterium]
MDKNIWHKTAVEILKATIGISSNCKKNLPCLPFKVEVKSLLSDFKDIKEANYSPGLDGYIQIEESDKNTTFSFRNNEAIFNGPFIRLMQEASDPRFTFWGNQGFLYRYALFLLEKKHGIYNLHACALVEEKTRTLYLIVGGAGSGKTVYLLSGLSKGLNLFSTETVHFRIDSGNVIWYMGSLIDNVRMGTLLYDFPQFMPDIKASNPDKVWDDKIALNLSSFKTRFEEIKNPDSVFILFPRIEHGFKGIIMSPFKDHRNVSKALFDNISQKLTETVVLYDKLPVLGFDYTELALNRLKIASQLTQHNSITQIASVISNPKNCWGELLKK